VLLKRLKTLESRLHDEFGAFESRAYVDTGPVVERSLAVAAGLGWTGKNTCVIHTKLGSFGFLAVLLTSLEVLKGHDFSRAAATAIIEEGVSAPALAPSTDDLNGIVTGGSRGLQAPETLHENIGPSGPGLSRQAASRKHEVSGHDFSRADDAAIIEEGASAPALAPSTDDLNGIATGGSRGLQANVTERNSERPSGPEAVATLPHPDRCGRCTRCIEACPTHALDTPYQMDASRCIAYLTIEHKGPIAEELMPGIGRQVFGCDICQDVCPWNSKAFRNGPIVTDPDLAARPELVNPPLEWLSSLDEQSFERLFNGSPIRRTGFNGLRRNIAIAMGNSGLERFRPHLTAWAEAADEGLRHAARWAFQRLRPPAEKTKLES
jgi:epoxyqueuosine reductase QueG